MDNTLILQRSKRLRGLVILIDLYTYYDVHGMSEKFRNLISVVNINSVITNITIASYSIKSNEYVYKISTRLIISVSSYIRPCTVCSWDPSYELVTLNKEAQ